MKIYRLTLDIEAESEDDAQEQFNTNIPEFEDFDVEEVEIEE